MSAGEVVRLTRIGKFNMDGEATGADGAAEAAARQAEQGAAKPHGGAGQMKMLRRIPKLLRFIPGTAQDVRAYFLTLQYWLAGSEDNIANMVRLLVDRYADGPRRPLARRRQGWRAPVEYPDVGAVSSAHEGPHRRHGSSSCRDRGRARHGRHPAAALLPAGRQRRPL